jgi:hypothetical protein
LVFAQNRAADIAGWLRQLILLNQRKLDTFAHGIDAFGAHADFIAEALFELARFCAAATDGHGKPCPPQGEEEQRGKLALLKSPAQWGRLSFLHGT